MSLRLQRDRVLLSPIAFYATLVTTSVQTLHRIIPNGLSNAWLFALDLRLNSSSEFNHLNEQHSQDEVSLVVLPLTNNRHPLVWAPTKKAPPPLAGKNVHRQTPLDCKPVLALSTFPHTRYRFLGKVSCYTFYFTFILSWTFGSLYNNT